MKRLLRWFGFGPPPQPHSARRAWALAVLAMTEDRS